MLTVICRRLLQNTLSTYSCIFHRYIFVYIENISLHYHVSRSQLRVFVRQRFIHIFKGLGYIRSNSLSLSVRFLLFSLICRSLDLLNNIWISARFYNFFQNIVIFEKKLYETRNDHIIFLTSTQKFSGT